MKEKVFPCVNSICHTIMKTNRLRFKYAIANYPFYSWKPIFVKSKSTNSNTAYINQKIVDGSIGPYLLAAQFGCNILMYLIKSPVLLTYYLTHFWSYLNKYLMNALP